MAASELAAAAIAASISGYEEAPEPEDAIGPPDNGTQSQSELEAVNLCGAGSSLRQWVMGGGPVPGGTDGRGFGGPQRGEAQRTWPAGQGGTPKGPDGQAG